MNTLVICGTNRPGAHTHKVANWVYKTAKKGSNKHQIIFIDFHKFKLPWLGEPATNSVKTWSRAVEKADALIIVTPEYNHGYPGYLKNALDLVYKELNYKPILVCGVSAGLGGGMRAVEQLRLILIEFRAVPIREAVYFRTAGELFDRNGEIKDKTYEKALDQALKELFFLAASLKLARQKKPF